MAVASLPPSPPIISTAPVASQRGSFFRLNKLDVAYAREMLLPMSLGVIVLILVLAGNFVYWAINSVVNQGMSLAPILKLFFYAAPGFAVLGIPVGVILGVCLVLNRAVRDNEILALRAGGASIPRIIAPFLFMALLASVLNWVMVEKVAPKTNALANKATARLMGESAAPFIDSDRYFHAGPYYFYVGTVENGVMHNVMIYQRDASRYSAYVPSTFPIVYIAASAYQNPKNKGQWILKNVVTHNYESNGSQLTQGRSPEVRINVEQQVATLFGEQKDISALTGNEITDRISALEKTGSDSGQLNKAKVAYWHHFALPGACFVMALCAAPLALRFARHGSFAGLVAAFLLAFLWQGFDGWFNALGVAGYVSPFIAASATNILFLLIGAALLVRER
ncbi:Lipopolysaccharide export LptBFGC system, permease protein LptF [Abditibacterium utsteinense]|uniref:Lipopolysaccharide export LptBFGC system, permease protein LptF n=1 Tax=Abditibacterium utsteinense TaxID=1960156 RepID=A0A2S8SPM3_9BACT|nr:LptF/LptG family permease [Abditibacterium utsteinense]PQV62729.1 Lipopolysaccharide export LptBFGC system, permease protein LptF [Abditibacterium utsteinense]